MLTILESESMYLSKHTSNNTLMGLNCAQAIDFKFIVPDKRLTYISDNRRYCRLQ